MTSEPPSSSPPPGLAGLGQIAVTVHDLDRAVAFYRDALGLPLLFRVPGMAFFDLDGVRLLLGLPEGEGPEHRASVLYFRTTDIAATHRLLRARGVGFEGDPHKVHEDARHELWLDFFRDPEGNLLALMEEVPRP